MATALFALVLLLLPSTSRKEAGELASRLETRYRDAKTLQATFLERYSENGAVLRTEAGTAYFRRPGKMRWEYDHPEKDLFLVDGKTAWFYVPADHTVTRVPAKQRRLAYAPGPLGRPHEDFAHLLGCGARRARESPARRGRSIALHRPRPTQNRSKCQLSRQPVRQRSGRCHFF